MSTVPKPVEVVNTDPLPVNVVADPDTDAQSRARVVATAAVVDANKLRTDDQRRISGMSERTQQIIALSVVETTLVVMAIIVATPGVATVSGKPISEGVSAAASTAIVFLASIANLVVGFYFGRTNHQRVGGVPATEQETR